MFTGISYACVGAQKGPSFRHIKNDDEEYTVMKLHPAHSCALVLDILLVLSAVLLSLLNKQLGMPENVKCLLLGGALGYSIPLAFLVGKRLNALCHSGYHYFP